MKVLLIKRKSLADRRCVTSPPSPLPSLASPPQLKSTCHHEHINDVYFPKGYSDLFATCADLLGKDLPPDAAEDSVSILPALLGKAKEPLREATIHQAPAGLAIRQGDWKLITLRNGTRELYNLKNDLSETLNLIEKNKEEAARLQKLLQGYIDKGRSTPGPVLKNEFDFDLEKSGDKKRNKKNKKNPSEEKQ